MEDIKIKIEFSPVYQDLVIIHVGGYVDQTNCFKLEEVIAEILGIGKKKIIINLHDVIYMSSAGWGLFVGNIQTVRKQGGDLKLAGMKSEIYEVFQMLEFYHILEDFATVEEAMGSYYESLIPAAVKEKVSSDVDPDSHFMHELLNASGVQSSPLVDKHEPVSERLLTRESKRIETAEIEKVAKSQARREPEPALLEKNIDISLVPVYEKIKKIIIDYPFLGLRQIRTKLRQEEYGNTQLSLYKLYRLLRTINLNTKQKRYRYHRAL